MSDGFVGNRALDSFCNRMDPKVLHDVDDPVSALLNEECRVSSGLDSLPLTGKIDLRLCRLGTAFVASSVLAVYSSNKSVFVSERMFVEYESDNCAKYSSNICICEYEYRNLCSYSSNTNTNEFCTGSYIREYSFRVRIMTLRYGVFFDRRGRTVPRNPSD
jgi:hypothetical protein